MRWRAALTREMWRRCTSVSRPGAPRLAADAVACHCDSSTQLNSTQDHSNQINEEAPRATARVHLVTIGVAPHARLQMLLRAGARAEHGPVGTPKTQLPPKTLGYIWYYNGEQEQNACANPNVRVKPGMVRYRPVFQNG